MANENGKSKRSQHEKDGMDMVKNKKNIFET